MKLHLPVLSRTRYSRIVSFAQLERRGRLQGRLHDFGSQVVDVGQIGEDAVHRRRGFASLQQKRVVEDAEEIGGDVESADQRCLANGLRHDAMRSDLLVVDFGRQHEVGGVLEAKADGSGAETCSALVGLEQQPIYSSSHLTFDRIQTFIARFLVQSQSQGELIGLGGADDMCSVVAKQEVNDPFEVTDDHIGAENRPGFLIDE